MTRALLIAAITAAALLGFACGGEGGSGNAPDDHTVSHDGVMHRPGSENPLTNCVSCHGANLEGDRGPSCTTCHGKEW